MVTTARRYGPHDDRTAPTAVTVLEARPWPQETDAPVPPALLAQRARINNTAWFRALAGGGSQA